MKNNQWLWWVGAGIGLFYLASQNKQIADTENFTLTAIYNLVGLKTQEQKDNYALYEPSITGAENSYNLPVGMLAKLLMTESSFLTSIIDGTRKSSTGAVGIAQFMPATAADFGIDPTNPYQSIVAAAQYLASLYKSTGDWTEAVAAYNWGIGHVNNAVKTHGDNWLAYAPSETQNYVSKILA